ncbi:MAG: YkvA family protein [Sphaerochaeta sp.]
MIPFISWEIWYNHKKGQYTGSSRKEGGEMHLREKAKTIGTYIPALFLAMRKKNTPGIAKVLAALTVGYALSPIDLIPDFIPVLGYLDDLIIVPLLITLTVRFIPPELLEECRVEAQGLWKGGKPKKWYYAIPVIVLWLLIIWWIISLFI